ncbi:MAG: pilin [Candidatus Levyibacteriota bacterium]
MNLLTQDWSSCTDTSVDPTGVAKLSCIWVVIQNVINAALILSGVVAIFLILWSGFQYVTSNGDKEKVDSARKRLTWAIIGLVFILCSFVLLRLISSFTGVSMEQLTQPGANP